MAQLTTTQYDLLERAIVDGRRIIVSVRGAEITILPLAIRVRRGRELIASRHPTTGDHLEYFIDELEGIDAV